MAKREDMQLSLFELDEASEIHVPHDAKVIENEESPFSKYIVYVDESPRVVIIACKALMKIIHYLFSHFVYFTSVTTAKR